MTLLRQGSGGHGPKGRPIGGGFEWLDKVIARAIVNAGALTEREAEFVLDMAERLDTWGARTFVSDPQLEWAAKIDEKLDEAGL